MEKRTNNITIHLTDTELVMIETLATNDDRKISEFVRLELIAKIRQDFAKYQIEKGLEEDTGFEKLRF